jgi:hypothetical protein
MEDVHAPAHIKRNCGYWKALNVLWNMGGRPADLQLGQRLLPLDQVTNVALAVGEEDQPVALV